MINSKKLIPALVYVIGMGSFFLVDILISSYEASETIAAWALLKSIIMIGAIISVVGLDQVMVRLPTQAKEIIKYASIIALVASFIYIAIIYILKLSDSLYFEFGIIFALSLGTLFFGYFRSQFKLIEAQIATNLWKIFFLLILVFLIITKSSISYAEIFLISALSSLFFTLSIYLFQKKSPYSDNKIQKEPIKKQVTLGYKFLISLLTLNLSLYLEQVLLNAGGHTEESSLYFTHLAIILPPIILINGYIGFILGPYIRKNSKHFDQILKNKLPSFMVLVFLFSLLALFASVYTYPYFIGEKHTYSFYLALVAVGLGILRTLYIIPSSYLGVHADIKTLEKFNYAGMIGILFLVTLYYTISSIFSAPLLGITTGILSNWLVRAGYGYYLTYKVHSTRARSHFINE